MSVSSRPFSPLLEYVPSTSLEPISRAIQAHVVGDLRRRGAVVAVSGGIDSSVCLALCVRALGPDHTLVLASLPDRHSSPESARLAGLLTNALGSDQHRANIHPILDGPAPIAGQIEAIRMVFPNATDSGRTRSSSRPSSPERAEYPPTRRRFRAATAERTSASRGSYLQIVAATNFKQRIRKMTEYYHADRLNYAVVGTPNRLEYDQGFFVKGRRTCGCQADRPSLQDAGLSHWRDTSGFLKRSRAHADDGHVLASADPGGVLFLGAVSDDGYLPLRAEQRDSRGRDRSRFGAHDRAGGESVGGHQGEAADYAPATPDGTYCGGREYGRGVHGKRPAVDRERSVGPGRCAASQGS